MESSIHTQIKSITQIGAGGVERQVAATLLREFWFQWSRDVLCLHSKRKSICDHPALHFRRNNGVGYGGDSGRLSLVVFLYYTSVCSWEDLNIVSFVDFITMEEKKQVEPSFYSRFIFCLFCFLLPSVTRGWKHAIYHLCNIIALSLLVLWKAFLVLDQIHGRKLKLLQLETSFLFIPFLF